MSSAHRHGARRIRTSDLFPRGKVLEPGSAIAPQHECVYPDLHSDHRDWRSRRLLVPHRRIIARGRRDSNPRSPPLSGGVITWLYHCPNLAPGLGFEPKSDGQPPTNDWPCYTTRRLQRTSAKCLLVGLVAYPILIEIYWKLFKLPMPTSLHHYWWRVGRHSFRDSLSVPSQKEPLCIQNLSDY